MRYTRAAVGERARRGCAPLGDLDVDETFEGVRDRAPDREVGLAGGTGTA
jgi:hypothetical protein